MQQTVQSNIGTFGHLAHLLGVKSADPEFRWLMMELETLPDTILRGHTPSRGLPAAGGAAHELHVLFD